MEALGLKKMFFTEGTFKAFGLFSNLLDLDRSLYIPHLRRAYQTALYNHWLVNRSSLKKPYKIYGYKVGRIYDYYINFIYGNLKFKTMKAILLDVDK